MPNTNQYYKSIEEAAGKQIRFYEKTGILDALQLLFLLTFIFSLLPVIPFMLTRVLPSHFRSDVLLWGVKLRFDSVIFWQLTVSSTSLGLFLLSLFFENRLAERKRKNTLSPAQLRFSLAFGAADQLLKYRTNKLENHLDESFRYFRHLLRRLGFQSGTISDDWMVIRGTRPVPVSQFHFLSRMPARYKWFKYSPETAEIIDAFHAVGSKLGPRIKNRKDLQRVEEALRALADYLYTEIPEISENQENDGQDWGVRKIQKFAEIVNTLPEYSADSSETKSSTGTRVWRGICYLGSGFQHPLPVVRFFVWLFLIVGLEWFGFWLCFKVWTNIKIDSAILVAVVGVPIAAAAAITTATKGPETPKE